MSVNFLRLMLFVLEGFCFVKKVSFAYMFTLGGFLLCGWGDGGRNWAEWTSISQNEMGEPQRTIFLHFLGGKSKSPPSRCYAYR